MSPQSTTVAWGRLRGRRFSRPCNLQSAICNLQSAIPMDSFPVTCPYCGELVEVYVEPDVRGSFVQDCEVCCNPWRVRVSRADGERTIDIARADGSE